MENYLVSSSCEYLERLQGKIRKCLFFCFKIFRNNSVNGSKARTTITRTRLNRPRPCYFTVQHRPQPRINFFISWNLGTRHLFSYLWYKGLVFVEIMVEKWQTCAIDSLCQKFWISVKKGFIGRPESVVTRHGKTLNLWIGTIRFASALPAQIIISLTLSTFG